MEVQEALFPDPDSIFKVTPTPTYLEKPKGVSLGSLRGNGLKLIFLLIIVQM